MAKILIAEDNLVNQRMLTFILNKDGHTVIVAGHGGEALELLAETPVDLIITDIDMPEMDGIALVKWVRADAVFQKLPIIILTASGDDIEYCLAREAGANNVLTKPTGSRQLLEAVEQVLT